MATRLEIDAPDLAASLSAASLASRNRAALAVVRAISSSFPAIEAHVAMLVASKDISAATVFAERLDEEYFSLNDQGDDKSTQRFSEARAAMAAKFAIEGVADESLYEAIKATDDGEYVKVLFMKALHNAI